MRKASQGRLFKEPGALSSCSSTETSSEVLGNLSFLPQRQRLGFSPPCPAREIVLHVLGAIVKQILRVSAES